MQIGNSKVHLGLVAPPPLVPPQEVESLDEILVSVASFVERSFLEGEEDFKASS